jgi:AAA15 family ATPase/GTPase
MIRSIQIKNFKAIADSGRIEITPLTVFVGHNGTGKSSVLEALEFFHRYIRWGVDEALEPWYDLDHILWQGHDREKPKKGDEFYPHPLEIVLTGRRKRNWRSDVRIGRLAEDTESQKARTIATKFEAFLWTAPGYGSGSLGSRPFEGLRAERG